MIYIDVNRIRKAVAEMRLLFWAGMSIPCGERPVILSSHKKIEKCSEQKLRQTRRRTQAGLTPGKDDNEVWHIFCRNRLKVSMGA